MYKHLVKVFGLERSGTNYLEWLLKENCPSVRVLTNQFGWKHGEPTEPLKQLLSSQRSALTASEETELYSHRSFSDPSLKSTVQKLLDNRKLRIVAIVKNPYSWYVSLMRYYRRQLEPITTAQLIRWNKTNRSYCSLSDAHPDVVSVIRYEDLLVDLESTFRQMASNLGMLLGDAIRDMPFRVEAGFRPSRRPFVKEHYLREDYLAVYSPPAMTQMKAGQFLFCKLIEHQTEGGFWFSMLR